VKSGVRGIRIGVLIDKHCDPLFFSSLGRELSNFLHAPQISTRYTPHTANMIRKQARERRDYLYRRALTLRDAELASKRAALKASLASGKPLSKDVANDQNLRQDFKYDESRADRTAEEELGLDDEYAQLSGVVDPRILVTTSRGTKAWARLEGRAIC